MRVLGLLDTSKSSGLVPAPSSLSDMLKLWGLIPKATCPLCSHPQCTLHHILVNCPFALNQGRYTWRHDSVLANLEPAHSKLITDSNKKKAVHNADAVRNSFLHSFVRAGNPSIARQKKPVNQCLLSCANDWQLLVDFNHKKAVFPPFICSTNLRPDVMVWSRMSRRILLRRLTPG